MHIFNSFVCVGGGGWGGWVSRCVISILTRDRPTDNIFPNFPIPASEKKWRKTYITYIIQFLKNSSKNLYYLFPQLGDIPLYVVVQM